MKDEYQSAPGDGEKNAAPERQAFGFTTGSGVPMRTFVITDPADRENPVEELSITNLLLHIGLIIAIFGLMLSWAL